MSHSSKEVTYKDRLSGHRIYTLTAARTDTMMVMLTKSSFITDSTCFLGRIYVFV